MLKAVFPLE